MKEYIKPIRLRIIAYLIVVLFPTCVSAQLITVHGIVKDQTGEPVIGASVVQKGTSNGLITDIQGHFVLHANSNSIMVISSIGYKTQQIPINGKTQFQVVLMENTKMLDEVVVVGYGSLRKSDLTGAVGSMDTKQIDNTSVSNLGQAIQGKISGVQIIDTGKPGDNVSIKIRGLGSVNNCDPLIVIDGVPTDLGLSSINMTDVERLDVLKDASATAIYGSRGANGVVMITTKRGKEGKGKLSFSANYAIKKATNIPRLLTASEYAQLSNEMMINSGRNPNPAWANPQSLGKGTDWMDELLSTGRMQNYTVSYSGGDEKSHYYISGGGLNQSGTVKGVGYRRFTFQANSDSQLLNWLKFSNNITFSADTKKTGDYDIGATMKSLPTLPKKNSDGAWSGPEGNAEWYGSIRNPIGPIELNTNETKGYNFLANMTAEITFRKWLKFKSTFGYDGKFWFNDSFTPRYDWKPTPVEESSRYRGDNKSFTYLSDNYFIVDYDISKKHHIGVMAGTSAQWNKSDYLNAQKNIFSFDSVHEMNNGEKMYAIGGSSSEWALMSYMARVNYSYKDCYLLTATVRRDGSSRFGSANRWGTFPSLSAAWRISKEKWFPKIKFIDDFKLRVGYGVTGSQASVGNYSYLASYNTGVYPLGTTDTNQSTLISATLANSHIHWEEVTQTNIGFDLSLFNSRAIFSLDAYLKETSDMLVKASIPITSGYEDTSTTYTNAGKVSNKGIEMSLETKNMTGEFEWSTLVSATYNKNKIKDLNSDVPYYINQIGNSYITMLAKGYPINVFYGYVTDGLFQNKAEVEASAIQPGAEAGDIRFKDLNHDGVINDKDRTVIGNPNPNWFFSMSNSLNYKGFGFSVFFQGVSGNKIYNANNIDNTGMAAAYNQTSDVLSRWTSEGSSNSMPRAVYGDPNQNSRVSNRFVESGAYLRLKNITFSYNIPKHWLSKIQIESAQFSISCENAATITQYSGFDSEVGTNGIDLSRYPISRTFSIGLNFNF